MPDWSYQTIFRPLLFRLAPRTARDITLGAIGAVGKLPGGAFVIRTLGHMESSPLLESEICGVTMKYPVGLSGGLDIHGVAQRAISQFGLGFIEIGPVTVQPNPENGPIRRDIRHETLIYPQEYANDGLDSLLNRLSRKRDHRLPLLFRLRHTQSSSPGEALLEQQLLIRKLAPYASAFVIDAFDHDWPWDETLQHLRSVLHIGEQLNVNAPLLLHIPLDFPAAKLHLLLEQTGQDSWDGTVIGNAIRVGEEAAIGKDGLGASQVLTRIVREKRGSGHPIFVSGGVHQPEDAVRLRQEGADYVLLHSGLVFAGPGLPKRINEALIYERIRAEQPAPAPSFWAHWGWMCLLGIGMMIGGLLAWLIAATSVVLPYDLSFLGMDRQGISLANGKLLGFMSHDRVTLAGTMISIGILYFQLACFGLRHEQHWSRTALLVSGTVGFSSFLLYLGYGYFDPLHAIVAALLLPLFILAMRGKSERPSLERPNMKNDRAWLLAQWGQLLFVMLGASLAVGGVVIACVGVTRVFVPEDLEYLCVTPAMLAAINDRLLPLIAHDRAGFGGALFSNALAILIMSLWGIGQGRRWLWWTLLIGGFPGFAAGFSVHAAIGYVDFVHLLPAYFAFILYATGLVLLYPYLMRDPGLHARLKEEV